MEFLPEPRRLSEALAELVAVRGLAGTLASRQLREAWSAVAGPVIARHTRVVGLRRGVLEIAVDNAPLLSELRAFHKDALLAAVRAAPAVEGVRDLRFRLRSDAAE